MKKILVIEDEPDIRENIVKILEYEGYQTMSADQGQRGITLAQQELPDLIICDILMPGLSGYGVLEKLRGDPVTAVIPFIFLTAISTKDDFRHGMALGADDYLTKPFQVEELLAAIRTRLEKQAAILKQMEELRFNLSAVLPHELRTPLNVILGVSEILLKSDQASFPPFEEMLQLQELIHNSALRLQCLIENYLLYANLRLSETDAEKRTLWQAQEPIAIKTLLLTTIQKKAKTAHRQKDLALALTDAQVYITAEHAQKIVEELLDNAFKFSEPGSPVTVISKIEGDWFLLEITDQGRGLNMAQRARIGAYMQFERTYYEQQGVGLGLILCRLLAQLHGGDLSIDSAPQQGTTVQVKLIGGLCADVPPGHGVIPDNV